MNISSLDVFLLFNLEMTIMHLSSLCYYFRRSQPPHDCWTGVRLRYKAIGLEPVWFIVFGLQEAESSTGSRSSYLILTLDESITIT